MFAGTHLDRRGWLALACVALLGCMLAAEAVHVERSTAACSICVVAHATAPAVAITLAPHVVPVHTVVLANYEGRTSRGEVIQLFVRPPPSV